MKRACVTLDAIRKSRIGKFQIKGAEREKQMKSYDEETEEGKVELIYGRLGYMIDGASKISGLTQKQYREWGKIECWDTNAKRSRGRSLSRRTKERKEIVDRSDRESSVNRRDRQRAADEEKKKNESQEKGKQNSSRKQMRRKSTKQDGNKR